MSESGRHGGGEHHIHAYNRMLEHIKHLGDRAERHARPALRHLIDAAELKMIELNELTREEAVKIGAFIERDIGHAAAYLNRPENRELIDWLKFDVGLIEARLLELFTGVADRTRVELLALEQQARRASEYHTGEITGIGTLRCTACGELLHFHATSHIPPCPKCRETVFVRSEE
jgi:D-serine deaminase-like pyridoxal phosphate-dependent protein